MLKPLIFILILVTLLAIGINLGLFDKTIEETSTKSSLPIKTISTIEDDKKVKTPLKRLESKNRQTNQDNNLSSELKELLRVASIYFQKSEDSEAFSLYDKVIQKTQNSSDPKILKFFAEALFRKATLHNIYPNNDPDSAIEDYNMVINKFNNSDDVELLRLYIEARLKQARLQSKDDLLSTYDELIKRFGNDKEQRFEKDVEELEFAQSFALMGEDKEKAMDVLDNMIAKYQARGDTKLPQTVEYSILNGVELSIITDNDDEKYVDLANKYLSKHSDTAPLLDMLKIMKNAQDLDQKEAIDKWMSEYKDYHFSDWDFSNLSDWADKMENPDGKKRIKEYLDIFLKQKYTTPRERVYPKEGDIIFKQNEDGTSAPYVVHSIENSEEQTPNIDNKDDENSVETNSYELEEMPYSNDSQEIEDNLYDDTYSDEPIYPNPYEKLPQDPNDGVSHTYNENTQEVNPY